MRFDNDLDDPYFWRFGRTKAKAVTGGIRSQAKKFGHQWWAARWLEAIEKFGPKKRVARGRSYARKGQIVNLRFEAGRISASVQGSRETPYSVEVFLRKLPEQTEADLLRDLQSQPIFAATLLSGELHPEIEQLFEKVHFPLFPTREEGRQSVCSCPDDQNPCKHIAAVYYIISEELGRDPFLLLELRGIGRDRMISTRRKLFSFEPWEALPGDPQQFWRAPRAPEIVVTPPAGTRPSRPPILQRLGSFPFWRGEQNFLETLERVYQAARERASETALPSEGA